MKKVTLYFIFLFNVTLLVGQNEKGSDLNFLERLDSTSQVKISEGRSSLMPFAAPAYTPEQQFVFTVGGLYTFTMDKKNPYLARSSMPFSVGLSTNGSINLNTKLNLYSKEDRWRVSAIFWMKNMPDNYWGVGYEDAVTIPKGKETTAYHRQWIDLTAAAARKVSKNFLLGLNFNYNYTKATEMNPLMVEDTSVVKYGSTVKGAGLGIVLRYDSRDFPENAYHGAFIEYKTTNYGRYFGGDNDYTVVQIDYRHYFPIQRMGSTLAWKLYARMGLGNMPWSEMSQLGSAFDLRGYTWGQFRDNTVSYGILEYRYMFKKKGVKVEEQSDLSRHGVVGWVASGAIGPDLSDVHPWVINYGVGYRLQIQPRMNLRLDYGFGEDDYSAFYLSFLEAF